MSLVFSGMLATALWIHIQVLISDSLGGAGAYLWVSVEEVCCLQPEWLLCEILYIYPSLLNPAFLKRLVPTIEQHFYQLFIQATVAMLNKSTLDKFKPRYMKNFASYPLMRCWRRWTSKTIANFFTKNKGWLDSKCFKMMSTCFSNYYVFNILPKGEWIQILLSGYCT